MHWTPIVEDFDNHFGGDNIGDKLLLVTVHTPNIS
jgi:hypothetical protein